MEYDIIYADPPWRYDDDSAYNGTNGWGKTAFKSRRVDNHYATMLIEDICKLNIPSNKNSVLYLWATAPKLLEALRVMNEWGFKYRTNMIWDKQLIGCGWWFRGQHELLLVGVKGSFRTPEAKLRISSVYRERRTKHSKKPDYIRDMISKWYPDKSKLELFARQKSEWQQPQN